MHHTTFPAALRILFAAALLPVLLLTSCGSASSDGEGHAYAFTYAPAEGNTAVFEADTAGELEALVSAWSGGKDGEPVLKDFKCVQTDGLLYRTAEVSFSGQSFSSKAELRIAFPYAVSAATTGKTEGRVWTVVFPQSKGMTFAASAEETSTVLLLCAAGILSIFFVLFFLFARKAGKQE